MPDLKKPVIGQKGSGEFVGKKGGGYTSFLDINDPRYFNENTGESILALTRRDYVSEKNKLYNNKGIQVIGEKILFKNEDGKVEERGTQIRYRPGTAVALRMPDSVQPLRKGENKNEVNTRCAITYNHRKAKNDIFIPTGSKEELKSYLTASSEGNIADVHSRNCEPEFLDYEDFKDPSKPVVNPNGSKTWVGTLSCDALTEMPACNETKIITAERYCLLDDGIMGECGECFGANDPDKNLKFTHASVGGEVMSNPSMGGSKCYFSAACFNTSATGCPSAVTSGGHVFCLAGDTLITMADGSKKAIQEIEAGEAVKSFDMNSKSDLKTAKISHTTITHNQVLIKIITKMEGLFASDEERILKITPRHKIVLASGRGVMAQDIRAGDKILNNEGEVLVVQDIDTSLPRTKVYNLVLEDGMEGYIANGIRVFSYPLMKELK